MIPARKAAALPADLDPLHGAFCEPLACTLHGVDMGAPVAGERVLVIGGLSKSMSMTGWRLGWAVGDVELIRYATVMHQYISSCASSVS